MLPTLSQKYYLAHAHELFAFVEKRCGHLLAAEHINYLSKFNQLGEDSQCMLVRLLSRKPHMLRSASLQYDEISDINRALDDLQLANFASPPTGSDWPELVPVLTRAELISCIETTGKRVKRSTSKAELVTLVRNLVDANSETAQLTSNQFVVRRQQSVVDYIQFLYFGDLRHRLQQFVMRDLGVLRTRKNKGRQEARFDKQEDAVSAFQIHCDRREFKHASAACVQDIGRRLLQYQPSGSIARLARDKLLLDIANTVCNENPAMAMQLWQASNHADAIECRVRHAYRHEDRDGVKQELLYLLEQELPAQSRVFVEDFYARKFEGKRTSIYTDMLRESDQHIELDEGYLNDVEEGCIEYYRRAGATAWFTENKLWRQLFALTFWDLLYGRDTKQHNEFDYLPAVLTKPHFYARKQQAIEQSLQSLQHRNKACETFMRLATRHYGFPTGLFRWRANFLDCLLACVKSAPDGALASVLRHMAKDFRNASDGYPDLMVVSGSQLRFEEIKAPGDVLRPNQLLSVRRLRESGFRVDISQVRWTTDPRQTYAVVDIETTGGRAGGHAITEVAVVLVRDQQVVAEWSTLVNPQRLIPAGITRLTGISNDMVAKAPVFAEIADELESRLQNSIFVAHNAGFDYGFIKAAYEAMGRNFRMPKFCTLQHARKSFPGFKSYSLGNLAAALDIDLSQAHRALSDATATAHLLILIQLARTNDSLAASTQAHDVTVSA